MLERLRGGERGASLPVLALTSSVAAAKHLGTRHSGDRLPGIRALAPL